MGGDSNLAIFRRFDDLNLLCLLSVQAEIVALRHQFYLRCDLNDQKGSPDERLFSTSFEKSRDGPSHQYNELKVLQEKLATYSKLSLL